MRVPILIVLFHFFLNAHPVVLPSGRQTESKAQLTISPEGEVLISTQVTLTCRNDDFRSRPITLKFGNGKHRATLSGSSLRYGTIRADLSHNPCRTFPAASSFTFCAANSALSVRFAATQELSGNVSCMIPSGGAFKAPPAVKVLRITDVFVAVFPPDPKAGQRVKISCGFQLSDSNHEAPKMTGLEDWTKLPDKKSTFGSHTLLNKTVQRIVTAKDNGREVKCSMKNTIKRKSLNIRYAPIIKMDLQNYKAMTVGSEIKCTADANPPQDFIKIYFRRSGGMWNETKKGVNEAQFRIPLTTEAGKYEVKCEAKNSVDRKEKERSFRVQNRPIRFFISRTNRTSGRQKEEQTAIGERIRNKLTTSTELKGQWARAKLEHSMKMTVWAAQLEQMRLWRKEHPLRMAVLQKQLQLLSKNGNNQSSNLDPVLQAC